MESTGHFLLIWMARMANSKTWMVAPDAYQKGPDTPKDHATLEDWRSVAAHVHFETTSAAVRPAEMVRPAVEYTSELLPVCSSADTFLFACVSYARDRMDTVVSSAYGQTTLTLYLSERVLGREASSDHAG